jgi:hypothetical protein
MNTIKKIINWLNYYCGGLRGDDCFFDVEENGMFDDLTLEEKITEILK